MGSATVRYPSVEISLADQTDVRQVAELLAGRMLNLESAGSGHLPFVVSNELHQSPTLPVDDFRVIPFVIGNDTFYLLSSATPESSFATIGLRGHRLAKNDEQSVKLIRDALTIIASRTDCMALVRKAITTFAVLEWAPSDSSDEPQLTSCSLPDVPLCAFLTDRASRHIPPLTLAEAPSPRHTAENIYHEAVHQMVNVKLLTEGLLPEDYDAQTGPRVPIFWRADSIERNRQWELDRVLHAAAVYVHLLDWRARELADCGTLSESESTAIRSSGETAIESARHLLRALHEHIDAFTPRGGLFIGKLAEAANRHAQRFAKSAGAASLSAYAQKVSP